MTIAALRALIAAELPHVIRHPSPRWTGPAPERTDMTNPPTPHGDPPVATVKDLLAWGDAHPTATLRRHAQQARTHLDALRAGQQVAAEVHQLTAQEDTLRRRLEDLRKRKADLLRPGTRRAPVAYTAAEVRTWAAEHNIPCPGHGRVPKDVVDAWQAGTTTAN